MFPHDLMRATHMKHHAYTNNPEKDPDHDTASAKSLWGVIVATQEGISKYQAIAEIYENDKAFMKSFNKGLNIGMLNRVILLTLVVFFPLETLLLWWLPSKFGVIYLSVFFSWYPHYQAETGRYKDTRFWSHWMPRYLNHSMQLHFIHHLHPGIGHYDEPKAIAHIRACYAEISRLAAERDALREKFDEYIDDAQAERAELEEWRSGKRIIRNQSLDEALNSGDGSYKP